MILGFKKQFASFVESGSKRHTVRAFRKRPFNVGDRLDMYTNVRQKNQRLLRREICTRTQNISIAIIEDRAFAGCSPTCTELVIAINGVYLSRDEVEEFAWDDGFREEPGSMYHWSSAGQMSFFWAREYDLRPEGVAWTGQLIHWRPSAPGKGPAGPKKKGVPKR